MAREILTIPHPVLRRRAAAVERFNPTLRRLAREMVQTMVAAAGTGLAAPQIGVAERLFVMRLRESDRRIPLDHPRRGQTLVLVNPKIVAQGEEIEEGIEACLSIPGYAGLVPRQTQIVVEARNGWGRTLRFEVDGFVARVMQHEIDHLDGILYLDRLESNDKLYRMTRPVPDEAGADESIE